MRTSEQTQEEFLKELKELLDKWDADIHLVNHMEGVPVRMTASLEACYKDGERVRDAVDIDLGDWFP